MELKDRLRDEWTALAPEWIEAVTVGGDRNIHRVGLLDAWMLEAVGEVSGLTVIDLGCGEGRFSRMLAEQGARVTGLDLCEPLIDYARKLRLKDEEYVLGHMEDLASIGSDSFDLAVSYITLVDVPDLKRATEEAFRVLRPGGRFVVCNLQSMVTAGNGWIKHNQVKLHYKLDDYFDESTRQIANIDLTNFHRTLSMYLNTFLAAGFAMEGLREPRPTAAQVAQYPELGDELRVPTFIIYLLQKPPK
ncbi:MAG: class I SAM-dependent methyltransferase [Chloroflexi bacterium]|nr:class I SAM-dependent methyltransferase [Chloroflexota bacterium]